MNIRYVLNKLYILLLVGVVYFTYIIFGEIAGYIVGVGLILWHVNDVYVEIEAQREASDEWKNSLIRRKGF